MPYRLRRVRLPGPHAQLKASARRKPFLVDLEQVTTIVGFSCSTNGWHPYVETLREYRQDPKLRYEESTLYRLYEKFQPASLQEAILDTDEPPMEPIIRWPATLAWHLWTLSPGQLRAAMDGYEVVNSKDLLYFGPVDHERFGRGHFERLIGVYNSIKKGGYRPSEFVDGYVEGHFIGGDDRYRFIVREGHHRVAALRVLGVSKVHVRLWDGLAVVRHGDLDRWTYEKGGLYPRSVIETLFYRLLTEQGKRKAHSLGLV